MAGGGAVLAGIGWLSKPGEYPVENFLGPVLPLALIAAGIALIVLGTGLRKLHMDVSPEGIRWRGGFVKTEDTAAAVPVVLEVHSKAEEEQEEETRQWQKAGKRKESKPVYRIASEVVIHSGYRQRDTQHVADFADDRQGLKAKLLASAIYAAIEEFTKATAQHIAFVTVRRMSEDNLD